MTALQTLQQTYRFRSLDSHKGVVLVASTDSVRAQVSKDFKALVAERARQLRVILAGSSDVQVDG